MVSSLSLPLSLTLSLSLLLSLPLSLLPQRYRCKSHALSLLARNKQIRKTERNIGNPWQALNTTRLHITRYLYTSGRKTERYPDRLLNSMNHWWLELAVEQGRFLFRERQYLHNGVCTDMYNYRDMHLCLTISNESKLWWPIFYAVCIQIPL